MTATTGRGLIQNPILCSPFVEPDRHFEFTADGIQNNVVQGRRPSCYFIPIPEPKKGPQTQLAFAERREAEENEEEAKVWITGLEQVDRHFGRRDGAKAKEKGKGKQRISMVMALPSPRGRPKSPSRSSSPA